MEDLRYLSVFALIGPVCATAEDGKHVNGIVQTLLNQGCSVKLDFHGVKLVTPTFYAAVNDGLYSIFPDSSLQRRFIVSNLPEV